MLSYVIVFVLAASLMFVFEKYVKNAWLVLLLTAFCAAALFQVFVFRQLGYIDPFFLIAFLMSFLIALSAAAVMLLIIRKLGTKMAKRNP
jgi:ABC-type thiamin/hydroxymethylpyrimidine transport system permease subunit